MSVSEIWEKLKNRYALVDQLHSLDMIQRKELARDIGVSEYDFDRFCTDGVRSIDELGRLMQALSLNIDEMDIANPGAITRDMSVVCCGCTTVDRCRRELEAGSAAQHYSEYCPNALTFEALLETEAQTKLAERNRDRQD